MTVEKHCDFRNVKVHNTVCVGFFSAVLAGPSVSPCVSQGTTIFPLQGVPFEVLKLQPSMFKCRTSKLVSSVLAAHHARWHGGTYAKPTLLGGDGTENHRI